MSDEDIIREALTLSSLERPRKQRVADGLAALASLIARCEQAEQALRHYAANLGPEGRIARAALDSDQRSRRET